MGSIKQIGKVCSTVLICVLAGSALAAPIITPIPAPAGFTRITSASLSASGGQIVGTCDSGTGTPTRAFLWTPASGSTVLTIPSPTGQTVLASTGLDLSADGAAILADLVSASGTESVRWTSTGGSIALQLPAAALSASAAAISADGQTIVGRSFFSGPGQSSRPSPAKWDAAGNVTLLNTPAGRSSAFASRVSDAGETIGGGAAPLNSSPAGALWVGARAEALTRPQGPNLFFVDSTVTSISGDGRFVVGNLSGSDIFSTPINGMFRWSTAPGAQPQVITKTPGSSEIFGAATNVDASVLGGKLVFRETVAAPVPGQLIEVDTERAMIWNAVDGPRLLQSVLSAQGASVGNLNFQQVVDLSSTGRDLLTLAATTPRGSGQFVLVRDLVTTPQCSQSDVAGANQQVGSDGDLTADDIIVFLGWYFASDSRGDVAGANQSIGADGSFTADDIIVFLGRYFAGC